MRPGIPFVPLLLGLFGLVPFWGLALLHLAGPRTGLPSGFVDGLLLTYAATIAAFLGGIRWGVAVRANEEAPSAALLLGAVVPQLMGWAFLFAPPPFPFFLLALLILCLGPLDRGLVRRGLAPAWFGRLRLLLSLLAGAALLLAGFS